MIARTSCCVRRSSSSLELFSSMKKCGIAVLGRNAFGAQIHECRNDVESFSFTCRKSGPTRRFTVSPLPFVNTSSGCEMLSIWWQFTQPIFANSVRPSYSVGACSLMSWMLLWHRAQLASISSRGRMGQSQ